MDRRGYYTNAEGESLIDITEFPDGQVGVKLTNAGKSRNARQVLVPVMSYRDLFILKSFADVIDNIGRPMPEIFIPCLLGQRSDRRFEWTESFDLKVICDVINSCGFSSVGVLDPHSDVSVALLDRGYGWKPNGFILEAIRQIGRDITLVSPDAGAYKKVFKFSESHNIPLVAANKFRDKDGEITLNFLGDVSGQTCLIIDDLADGGYTFHLLAKALKEQGAEKVFLYVTHGYFHKGFDLLRENIDHIYTTNSTGKEFTDEMVTQLNFAEGL